MKKTLLIILFLPALTLASCSKTTPTDPSAEIETQEKPSHQDCSVLKAILNKETKRHFLTAYERRMPERTISPQLSGTASTHTRILPGDTIEDFNKRMIKDAEAKNKIETEKQEAFKAKNDKIEDDFKTLEKKLTADVKACVDNLNK